MWDPSDPLSLNRYVYCGLDPVNYVDPTGFCGLYIEDFPLMDQMVKEFDGWLRTNCPAVANAIDTANKFTNSLLATPPGMSVGIVPFMDGDLNWGKLDTLTKHFNDHGADFGAKTETEYAKMANDFYNNRNNYQVKVDKDGIIRVYDPNTNTFGSYNPDGTTRTFFQPSSSTYFDRQSGQ